MTWWGWLLVGGSVAVASLAVDALAIQAARRRAQRLARDRAYYADILRMTRLAEKRQEEVYRKAGPEGPRYDPWLLYIALNRAAMALIREEWGDELLVDLDVELLLEEVEGEAEGGFP